MATIRQPKNHRTRAIRDRSSSVLLSSDDEPTAEVRDYYLFAKRLLEEPDRTKAIRQLDKKRREYLEAHPIPAKLHGRNVPNKRGRPKTSATVNARSLAIFLAVKTKVASRADILRVLDRAPLVGTNAKGQYEWLNRRIQSGRETFSEMTQRKQLNAETKIGAMDSTKFLNFLSQLPPR